MTACCCLHNKRKHTENKKTSKGPDGLASKEYFAFMQRSEQHGSLLAPRVSMPSLTHLGDMSDNESFTAFDELGDEDEPHLVEDIYYNVQKPQPGTWKTYNNDEFRTIKLNIHRGSTCKIHLVQHMPSKIAAIMKSLYGKHAKEARVENSMAPFTRDSPFLLKILDGFRQVNVYYILLEYAPFRTLDHLTQAIKGLGSDVAGFYVLEIACALEFLHSHEILHRDVKPENMFILSSGHVALGDYGSCWDMSKGEQPTDICGTYVTRPPEVWSNLKYSYSADIWQFGISVWNIIANKWPILHPNKPKHIYLVQKGSVPYTDEFTNVCQDFVSKMLQVNPEKRMKIKDVLSHNYIQNIVQSESFQPPYTPVELLRLYRNVMKEDERKNIEKLLHLEESHLDGEYVGISVK